MECSKCVDVSYGNGEVTEFPEDGIASKWFPIKALCGNTVPHAVLPLGKMSVGAFSGGYPTGYGTHYPNSCGGIKKLSKKMKIRGFSHLHQSGTGAIAYYYNYAPAIPFYGKLSGIKNFHELESEAARPGEYSATFNGVNAKLTVTTDVAFHSYRFDSDEGRLALDFSNNGLSKRFDDRYYSSVKNAVIRTDGKGKAFCRAELSGVTLFFCAKAEGKNVSAKLFENLKEKSEATIEIEKNEKPFGVVFDFDGRNVNLKLAFSTIDFDFAEKAVDSVREDFETTSQKALETWEHYLSAIRIKTDDNELRQKFYSNFYHSVVKPCIATGENILGVSGDVVFDFATFWDQYKTLFPLIFMLYKNEGEKIASAISNISRTLGKIPCSFGMSDVFPCEEQAKMLGVIALCDAFHSGLCSEKIVTECIKRELLRDDYRLFFDRGIFERYTHILDVTDACLDVARITSDKELKKRLLTLAENWKNAYGDDGLMSEKSPYYEGDRYTYSFRLQSNMEQRVELAGGKEPFEKMLDSFFGFGKSSLKPITTKTNARLKILKTAYHRFEGFNNECDMETPFAYIFADRHEKLCEISHAAVFESFKTGTNGIPGNNDSGGLSSCFMWLVLGIFPWAGTGIFLLGCPQADSAEISLSNGNRLKIKTSGSQSGKFRKVERITFNGEIINNYRIEASLLFGGGELEFVLK